MYEKESLAVLFSLETFSSYTEHEKLDLFTDNQALSWVLNHSNQMGKLVWCVPRLSRFIFRIFHIKGKEDIVADMLSHIHDPSEFEVVKPSHLMLLHAFPDCFVNIKKTRE